MSVVLALMVVMAGPSAPTVAEKLASAEALAAELDYEEARDELLAVVSDPRAGPGELKAAHLLAGEVDRILGRDVDARMHFLWVLSRDPSVTLAPGKPLKVTAFFELVRDEFRAGRSPDKTMARPSEETEPPPREPSPAPLFVMAGAGVVLAAGVVGVTIGEMGYADGRAPYATRAQAQQLGVTSWATCTVGAVGLGVGALWWTLSGR